MKEHPEFAKKEQLTCYKSTGIAPVIEKYGMNQTENGMNPGYILVLAYHLGVCLPGKAFKGVSKGRT
nr:hypothetical protein A6C57_21990 [Fibrella sp. ES10-3-2-2]